MEPGPGPKPTQREREEVRMGFRMMGIGFEAVSQVVAGLLLGWLWDQWRGSEIGVIVGGAAGVLVGVLSLVKSAWKLNAELDRSAAKRRKGGAP
jgi:F0F1-type ATP synthase assembly protein I